jgi:hypothetical protein
MTPEQAYYEIKRLKNRVAHLEVMIKQKDKANLDALELLVPQLQLSIEELDPKIREIYEKATIDELWGEFNPKTDMKNLVATLR